MRKISSNKSRIDNRSPALPFGGLLEGQMVAMGACLSMIVALGCGCSRQEPEQETKTAEETQPTGITEQQDDAPVKEGALPPPATTE